MAIRAEKHRTGIRDPAIVELAHLVRERRRAFDLTQRDLAALANTGVRFIVELEQGKPTLEIGKVFGVLQTLGLEVRVQVKPPALSVREVGE